MLRPMRVEDLKNVTRIDLVSHPQYWLRARFEEALRCRDWAMVSEASGQILGYCVSHIGAECVEVFNLTVAPLARRHGIAKMLLMAVCSAGYVAGCWGVVLQVREMNLSAHKLYKWFGFECVGRYERYYMNADMASGYEDALLMRKSFLLSPSQQSMG